MNDIRSLIEKIDQLNESEEVNRVIRDAVNKLGPKPTIANMEQYMNTTVKTVRDELQSRDDDSFIQGFLKRRYEIR